MAKLTEKQIDVITNGFYSCFCGINLSEVTSGITFVCSDSRNDEVRGFGCKYSIYVLVQDKICVVSFAPQYTVFFEKLQGKNIDDILTALDTSFKIKKMQLMKFKQERVSE